MRAVVAPRTQFLDMPHYQAGGAPGAVEVSPGAASFTTGSALNVRVACNKPVPARRANVLERRV